MIKKYFTILLPQLGLTPCKEATARNAICAYFNENNIFNIDKYIENLNVRLYYET